MGKKVTVAAILSIILLSSRAYPEDNKNVPDKMKEKAEISVIIENEPAVIIGGFKITLGQAIRQAIEQNHDILSGKYDVAMTDSLYRTFQKKYSVFLNAGTGIKYQKYPESLATLTGRDKTTVDASISLAKMFSTGTTVAAGVSSEYAKTSYDPIVLDLGNGNEIPLQFGLDRSYTPVAFVSIQQELLKNSFGFSERRQEKILKNLSKMQKDHVISMLSMVVLGVIADYWNVILQKKNMMNAEFLLSETRKVRNIMGRNVRLGLADSFNINYYNLLVAGSEARLTASKQNYRDTLRRFLSAVNMDERTDLSGSVVLTDRLPELKLEAELKTAFEKRADYSNAKLNLENAKLDAELQERNSLPSLTAELNIASMGQSETPGESYSDAAALNYPTLEARLRLSHPLDDSEQKIKLRNARYRLKQAKINLQKTERAVKDEISGRVENIMTAHEIYEKSKKAKRETEAFYYKMLGSLRRGRLDSATVKNGIDAMVESRQSELGSLIYYNITLLRLVIAKNQLWEKYMIDVEKYIPKENK